MYTHTLSIGYMYIH